MSLVNDDYVASKQVSKAVGLPYCFDSLFKVDPEGISGLLLKEQVVW
jgi:hypothetical protein